MSDRLAEIKARWVDGTLGYSDYASLGAAAAGKADVDWLVAEVERLSHLHRLDHSLADQWQADNERLRALLANLEWRGAAVVDWDDWTDACPVCDALKEDGIHAPDCGLAKELLREVEG